MDDEREAELRECVVCWALAPLDPEQTICNICVCKGYRVDMRDRKLLRIRVEAIPNQSMRRFPDLMKMIYNELPPEEYDE